jgi:hypothetical protein
MVEQHSSAEGADLVIGMSRNTEYFHHKVRVTRPEYTMQDAGYGF